MTHGVAGSQRPPGPCLRRFSCPHDLSFPCLIPSFEPLQRWGTTHPQGSSLRWLTCSPLVASALPFWPRSICPTPCGLTALRPGSEMTQGTGQEGGQHGLHGACNGATPSEDGVQNLHEYFNGTQSQCSGILTHFNTVGGITVYKIGTKTLLFPCVSSESVLDSGLFFFFLNGEANIPRCLSKSVMCASHGRFQPLVHLSVSRRRGRTPPGDRPGTGDEG